MNTRLDIVCGLESLNMILLGVVAQTSSCHKPETWGRIHKEILSLRQKIVSALRFGLS